MKKLMSLTAAGVMIGSGMLAIAPTASAGEPYPGTVKTVCVAQPAVNNSKHSVKVTFVAKPANGTGKPKGSVTISAGKATEKEAFKGSAITVSLGKFKPGKYTGKSVFKATSGSVYKGCSDSFSFKVKRRG